MSEETRIHNILKGHPLTAIYHSDNNELLKIVAGDQVAYLATYADCCSETWFADILGAVITRGGIITSINVLDMPEIPEGDTRTRQEYDQQYGFEIRTTRGVVIVAYRNSSNGYYGGDLENPDRVRGLNLDAVEWAEIIDDNWSA